MVKLCRAVHTCSCSVQRKLKSEDSGSRTILKSTHCVAMGLGLSRNVTTRELVQGPIYDFLTSCQSIMIFKIKREEPTDEKSSTVGMDLDWCPQGPGTQF